MLFFCDYISTNFQLAKLESPNDLIGIVEVDNKLFHVGTKFGVHPGFVIKNGLVGKKVKIIKYDFNTDEKAKDYYPYFASIIQPME